MGKIHWPANIRPADIEKAELSLAGYIIVVLIRPREFDANLRSLEVINISIKRNFLWMK